MKKPERTQPVNDSSNIGIYLALRSINRPKESSNGIPHPIYSYFNISCTIFFSSPFLLISAHLFSNFLRSFYPIPFISTDFHYSLNTVVLSTSPHFVHFIPDLLILFQFWFSILFHPIPLFLIFFPVSYFIIICLIYSNLILFYLYIPPVLCSSQPISIFH